MNRLFAFGFVCCVWFGAGLHAATRVEVGVLRVEVSISRTATLFHVVDQVSEWNVHCHRQYRRAFGPLSEADRGMLAQHRALRARHGWGQGLEQTLYSDLDLPQALEAGVQAGHLTPQEAATEREILLHFAGRIDAMAAAQAGTLEKFRERLTTELPAAAPVIAQFARFARTTPELVPVFLLPDPDPKSGGGGYNGGRLTLEIPSDGDAMSTALHEIFHAFLHPRLRDLARAAEDVPGLDSETLNEGIAYAFSPGIVHRGPAESDPLAKTVAADYAAGRTLDAPYVRSNRYGLALRPLLRQALADPNQTLDTFLPRAVDVWRAIHELDTAAREEELRTVTILRLIRADAPELKEFAAGIGQKGRIPAEYFAPTREWVKGTYRQLRTFYEHASHDVLLVSPGHPDIRARFNGHTVSRGDGSFQAFGLEVIAEDRPKIVAEATYTIQLPTQSGAYRWAVSEQFVPVKLGGGER